VVKKDDFRILAAQFNGDPRMGVKSSYRDGISHNLLNIDGVDEFGDVFSPGTTDSDPEFRSGKFSKNLQQEGVNCFGLAGIMTGVAVQKNSGTVRIQRHDFRRCGAHVKTKPKAGIYRTHVTYPE
jgi:hypothetical protein